MHITTQDFFADYEIVSTLGLVRGNVIRARNVGRDIMAGMRSIVGGEIVEYTKLIAESREQAIDRMKREATAMGADGIVAVRFTTSSVMSGASELFVYGTAVKLRSKV